jgi:hypothetical protein
MLRVFMAWMGVIIVGGILAACGSASQGGDTQTNWLRACETSEQCGALECVCGRCTKACESNDCSEMGADAVCVPATSPGVQELCQPTQAVPLCLKGCESTAECLSGEQCIDGGCVGEPEPPVGMGDDASGFCQLWVDSFATYMESCGCGADAAARYRATSLCETDDPFGGVAAAVARGDLRYDAAAAESLFERLDAADPLCVEEPYRDLQLDSSELYSLAGVFTGTHALGEPCTMPVSYKGGVSDCAEGVCAPDGAGNGVCIALVGPGEECDASGDENLASSSPKLCHESRPPDSDGEYESAFDFVSCVVLEAGAPAVCVTELEDGAPCSSDEICTSGRCATATDDATCQPKVVAGEACNTSGDCLTGACRYDVTPSVCGELLPDGTLCNYDDAACESGTCLTSMLCGPPPSAPVGANCATDDDCQTGTCRGGSCFADICGDHLDP